VAVTGHAVLGERGSVGIINGVLEAAGEAVRASTDGGWGANVT